MDETDAFLEDFRAQCSLLEDDFFLETFPGISDVASFFYSSMQRVGLPPVFKEIGVETIGDYLRKVNDGDKRATEVYEKMRDLCGFGMD